MKHAFRNILVPVDFSINTEVALKKAMEVADGNGSRIFLLHVLPVHEKALIENKTRNEQANRKLAEIKSWVGTQQPSIHADSLAMEGNKVQEAIEKTADMIGADLIIIGKKCSHSWLPFLNTIDPDRLAKKTGLPVLTTRPGALHSPIKTLVVPLHLELSFKELDVILALCKKTSVQVHLVSFEDQGLENQVSAEKIIRTFSLLTESLPSPLVHQVLNGANRPRQVLEYAQKSNADLLLVRPGMEIKTGWLNTNISDLIPAHSKVQVMTV